MLPMALLLLFLRTPKARDLLHVLSAPDLHAAGVGAGATVGAVAALESVRPACRLALVAHGDPASSAHASRADQGARGGGGAPRFRPPGPITCIRRSGSAPSARRTSSGCTAGSCRRPP